MLQTRVRRGELDRELIFIKKNITDAVIGEDYVESWSRVVANSDVYGRKRELAGSEVVVDNQVKYYQKTVFVVDHRTDLTTNNRVIYNAKVYEIIAITDNEMGRGTYIDVVSSLLDTEPNPIGGGFSDGFEDESFD